MALTPLPEDLARFGAAEETGGFKSTIGAYKIPDGLVSVEATPARAQVDRMVQRNSAKDAYAAKPGNQSFDLVAEVYASDQTAPDCGDWIRTSMGEEVTADDLTFASASTTTSVTVSDGVIDNIARVRFAAGTDEHRPGIVSGSTITWAIKPSGTPTDILNASQTTVPTGRAFRDKAFGAVTTYRLETDQGDATGEVWFQGKGAVPGPFQIVYTLDGLLKLRFPFKAATWTADNSAGGSALSDPADVTETYLSDVCSFGIQAVASAADALVPLGLKALDVTLGYDFIPRTAAQGHTGGAVSGSNITGWVRGNSMAANITVTLDDGDFDAWDTLRLNETPQQLWAEFQPGNPTDAVGVSRICLWLPQVKIVDVQRVKVNGLVCTQLGIYCERDAGNSLRRAYLSIFGENP
jgi:hypothetical protein